MCVFIAVIVYICMCLCVHPDRLRKATGMSHRLVAAGLFVNAGGKAERKGARKRYCVYMCVCVCVCVCV